jgi:hypothetical protein
VQTLDLPISDATGDETPPPAAAAVTSQATASAGARRSQSPTVRPQDVAEWGIDKQLRFREQHPDEWEALKRGEEVTGIAV